MNTIKGHQVFMMGAACALLLAGCGGGGGDGDTGIIYNGPTSAASITPTNGKEIASTAFLGGSLGSEISTMFAFAATTEEARDGGVPSVTTVAQALLGAINRVDWTAAHQSSLSRALQSVPIDPFYGNCGGSIEYSIRLDDVSGAFDGTTTFKNFCEDGATTNGVIKAKGYMDLDTYEVNEATITFANLGFNDGVDSVALDGSIAVTSPSATSVEVTTNMKMKDNNANKVFWAEDYVTTITSTMAGDEVDISGRFYNPDYGFVDLDTFSPIFTAATDEWPSSGVMIAEGASGSKVKLTAVSNTTYHYEVDADGDGVYEHQELNQLWDDL